MTLIPSHLTEDQRVFWHFVPAATASDFDADVCWPWAGALFENGYGNFGGIGAHRVAYYLHYDRQPGRSQVRNRCGNKACCNPLHLYIKDPVIS